VCPWWLDTTTHPTGRRICFVLQVRTDRAEEYCARHATVWPAIALDQHAATLIGMSFVMPICRYGSLANAQGFDHSRPQRT